MNIAMLVVILSVLAAYFAIPAVSVAWLVFASRRKVLGEVGMSCLTIWLVSAVLVGINLANARFEGNSDASNVFGLGLFALAFIVQPIVSLTYMYENWPSPGTSAANLRQ